LGYTDTLNLYFVYVNISITFAGNGVSNWEYVLVVTGTNIEAQWEEANRNLLWPGYFTRFPPKFAMIWAKLPV